MKIEKREKEYWEEGKANIKENYKKRKENRNSYSKYSTRSKKT